MKRILFIRGGALGDFVVTLPTLRLLREKWPEAHIELLGQPRIAEIAVNRYYLDATRSVNHGPLSAFFTPRAVLDPTWMDYIGSFDLVLSYFYDPDGLFVANLKRCRPGQVLTHPPRVPDSYRQPAARYFAGILKPLDLTLTGEPASELFPQLGDAEAAQAFLSGLTPDTRLIAIHPGSGSESKNWPVSFWAEVGQRLVQARPDITLLLVDGEADVEPAQFLCEAWKDLPFLRARWLPLPVLAAVLRKSALFMGHDSGITHLAAASSRNLPVIALFGPTIPEIWAPPRPGVHILKGTPSLKELSPDIVFQVAIAELER